MAGLCEQCGRQTDYLFAGYVVAKATRYKRHAGTILDARLVDVRRDAMVCQRCRPPSNLEKKEILAGDYKGKTLELRTNEPTQPTQRGGQKDKRRTHRPA